MLVLDAVPTGQNTAPMDLVAALLPMVLLGGLLAGLLRLSQQRDAHRRRRGAQYDLGPGQRRDPRDRVFASGAPYGSGS